MKRPLLAALLLLLSATGSAAQIELVIASDDWCPYICARENERPAGFLVDALDLALRDSPYRVTPRIMPLKRVVNSLGNGDIDGIYAPALDSRFAQTDAFTHSVACFYTRDDSRWRYDGIASLAALHLGVIADYGYDAGELDRYLAAQRTAGAARIEFNLGEGAGQLNLRKLLAQRYDVIVEHESVMTHLQARAGVPATRVRKAGCATGRLPLVIGFGKETPPDAVLIQIINQRVNALRHSGELAALLKKYRIAEAAAPIRTGSPPP